MSGRLGFFALNKRLVTNVTGSEIDHYLTLASPSLEDDHQFFQRLTGGNLDTCKANCVMLEEKINSLKEKIEPSPQRYLVGIKNSIVPSTLLGLGTAALSCYLTGGASTFLSMLGQVGIHSTFWIMMVTHCSLADSTPRELERKLPPKKFKKKKRHPLTDILPPLVNRHIGKLDLNVGNQIKTLELLLKYTKYTIDRNEHMLSKIEKENKEFEVTVNSIMQRL